MSDTTSPRPAASESAVLGGGCFWCLEAVYRELAGVTAVESGYAGGAQPNPTYDAVCGGRTGHAEVVKVTFDPSRVSFRELLAVFFTIHDPTTKDRQGNDVGSQYRSVIFAQSPAQKQAAKDLIREISASKLYPAPIVTEVRDAEPYFAAEAHHQEYFERNPAQPYCMAVVAPKVAKFRKHYADKLRLA